MEHAPAGYQSNHSAIRPRKIVSIELRTSFTTDLMKLAAELEASLREFVSAGAAEFCENGGRLAPLSNLPWEVRGSDDKQRMLKICGNRRRLDTFIWKLPALRFHPVTGILLDALSPQIEVVRVGLTESWRRGIRVVMRQ